MEKLFKLADEYMKQHEDAQDPRNFLQSYGVDSLIEIIEEAKGREIVFEDDLENPDAGDFKYVD